MAQNFSYFQNQLQNGGAQQAGAVPGGNPAMPTPAQSMGINPQQLAALQQMLANPNAGDAYGAMGAPGEMPEMKNPFGDPRLMLVGGLVGIPVSMVFDKLHGKDHEYIAKVAGLVDDLPGVRNVSHFIDEQLLSRLQGQWADEMLQRTARSKGAARAIERMQLAQILGMVKPYAAANPALAKQLRNARTFENFSKVVDDEVLKILKGIDPATLNPKMAQKVADAVAKGTVDRKVIELAQKVATTEESKATLKLLAGFHRGVKSLIEHYMPMFADQAVLAEQLGKKNVGPIGRLLASTSNYIRRMFGGEALKGVPGAAKSAASEGSGLFGKMFGPFIAGFITFGSALSKAKDAPAGEKVSTFFHDFLGFGVGTLIGMEVGAKFLRAPIAKLLGGKALSTPLKFLRFIPGIGPWLAGVTAVGFITQMLAMTVMAEPFKKLGEWIAHSLFGKPSQETLDKIEGKTHEPKNNVPANANNQPLARSGRFEQFRRSIQGGGSAIPAANGAHAQVGPTGNPNFSLSPDMISQSMAAQRHDSISQEVINAPWNPHGFNPMSGH